MNKLKYLGNLPSSCDFDSISKLQFSPSTYQSILIGIGQLLDSNTFKEKSQAKDVLQWNELFINLNETTTIAKIASCNSSGNKYSSIEDERSLVSLTLGDIKSFQSYGDGYILAHTVETHKCSLEMECPICNGSGACWNCGGSDMWCAMFAMERNCVCRVKEVENIAAILVTKLESVLIVIVLETRCVKNVMGLDGSGVRLNAMHVMERANINFGVED